MKRREPSDVLGYKSIAAGSPRGLATRRPSPRRGAATGSDDVADSPLAGGPRFLGGRSAVHPESLADGTRSGENGRGMRSGDSRRSGSVGATVELAAFAHQLEDQPELEHIPLCPAAVRGLALSSEFVQTA
jgi:hypothetical protein